MEFCESGKFDQKLSTVQNLGRSKTNVKADRKSNAMSHPKKYFLSAKQSCDRLIGQEKNGLASRDLFVNPKKE